MTGIKFNRYVSYVLHTAIAKMMIYFLSVYRKNISKNIEHRPINGLEPALREERTNADLDPIAPQRILQE